ncbi:MAG: hypothetical protein KA118_04605 [Verrucomicrobia bacterium]|nr:hypothetical protein [Verrucomicrobiota bacterium]
MSRMLSLGARNPIALAVSTRRAVAEAAIVVLTDAPFCFSYSTMNVTDLSAAQLRRAAAIKEQLEKLQKELAGILGAPAEPAAAAAAPRKRRRMSAAARAAMSRGAKERWAKRKGIAQPAAEPKKKKSTVSDEAKAAMSRAAKARWAKKRAASKLAVPF